MFSVEAGRKGTGGGEGGWPLYQQLFSIHFEDDRLQIVAAGNICICRDC